MCVNGSGAVATTSICQADQTFIFEANQTEPLLGPPLPEPLGQGGCAVTHQGLVYLVAGNGTDAFLSLQLAGASEDASTSGTPPQWQARAAT